MQSISNTSTTYNNRSSDTSPRPTTSLYQTGAHTLTQKLPLPSALFLSLLKRTSPFPSYWHVSSSPLAPSHWNSEAPPLQIGPSLSLSQIMRIHERASIVFFRFRWCWISLGPKPDLGAWIFEPEWVGLKKLDRAIRTIFPPPTLLPPCVSLQLNFSLSRTFLSLSLKHVLAEALILRSLSELGFVALLWMTGFEIVW